VESDGTYVAITVVEKKETRRSVVVNAVEAYHEEANASSIPNN
jgi:hypothetical protein